VNLVPEVLTKPVDAGADGVEIGVVTVVVVVLVVLVGGVVVGGAGVVVAVPGTHCQKNGFWTTHTEPAAQAAQRQRGSRIA
jgi:hypothetical protein